MSRTRRIPLAGVVSLGCSKNLVDTEYLVGGLGAGGWGLVADRERADLLLVNNCAFIGPAVEESHEAIADAVAWKERLAGRTVVVAGCMVNRFAGELAARYPQVDFFLTPKQIPRLGEWLALAPPRPRRLGAPGRAFLPGERAGALADHRPLGLPQDLRRLQPLLPLLPHPGDPRAARQPHARRGGRRGARAGRGRRPPAVAGRPGPATGPAAHHRPAARCGTG